MPSPFGGGVLFFEPAAKHCGQCLKRPAALAFCARTRQWRVPEKILFGAALLGGSAGVWAGMYVFHHKTRHWYFVVGIPLILAAQLALAVYFTR